MGLSAFVIAASLFLQSELRQSLTSMLRTAAEGTYLSRPLRNAIYEYPIAFFQLFGGRILSKRVACQDRQVDDKEGKEDQGVAVNS